MKPDIQAIIVGAGGITSYFLPAFLRTFNVTDGLLIDGDILEERNLDRQLFTKNYIGKNKAEALLKVNKCKALKCMPSYLDGAGIGQGPAEAAVLWSNLVIIALVDNHIARRAALELAEELSCPIIMGANELETAQAIYYNHTPETCPLRRYPDMATDNSGSPFACQGEEAEAAAPQLAMANMMAASFVLDLLWKWNGPVNTRFKRPEAHMPIEFQSTYGALETITYGQASKVTA